MASCLVVSAAFWVTYYILGREHQEATPLLSLGLQFFLPGVLSLAFGWAVASIVTAEIPTKSPYLFGVGLVLLYSCTDLIARNLIIRLGQRLPTTQAVSLALISPVFSILSIGVFLVPVIIVAGLSAGYILSKVTSP
jgi:drug/metabolite transporter (DMT)-like permease